MCEFIGIQPRIYRYAGFSAESASYEFSGLTKLFSALKFWKLMLTFLLKYFQVSYVSGLPEVSVLL